MAKWYSVLFSVIYLSWVVCDAVSLLGETVYFPLIPTDPLHIFTTMFNPNASLPLRCAHRMRTDDLTSLRKPSLCFEKYAKNMEFHRELDATRSCRSSREFLGCIVKAMDDLDEVCLWNNEEETVYNYPLKAFEASLDYVCNDNATHYKEFKAANGQLCVSDAEDDLQTCMNEFEVSDMLNYGHDNCQKAWGFYDCCDDKLLDMCDDAVADSAMKMVVEALAVTPCREQAHKKLNLTMTEQHKALPKKLPDNVVIEEEEENENVIENASAASTDNDVGNGAARCSTFLVWTLLLYILIAA